MRTSSVTPVPGGGSAQLADPAERILSKATCLAILDRIGRSMKGGGQTSVAIRSYWIGNVRWNRNDINNLNSEQNIEITLQRSFAGTEQHRVRLNQIDEASIQAAMRYAEWLIRNADHRAYPRNLYFPGGDFLPPATRIWSDRTAEATADDRWTVADTAIQRARQEGLMTAGFVQMATASWASAVLGDQENGTEMRYDRLSEAQCSMSARDVTQRGAGSTALSSYDWETIDWKMLAEGMVDRCIMSRSPVRLEPGRYTVVLQPEVVATLVRMLFGLFDWFRLHADDGGRRSFYLGYDDALMLYRTKLGLKLMDERLSITHDPIDPVLGIPATPGLKAITWVENGVLMTLPYDRSYALRSLSQDQPELGRSAFRVSGGETRIDDMIASTERGLLINRLWGVESVPSIGLFTGLTRDGCFLIEKGKIVRACENFRVTESILAVLNQVDQVGPSVRTFHPSDVNRTFALSPWMAPSLKIKDFHFTSLSDAI